MTREQAAAQFGGRTPSFWGLEVPGVATRVEDAADGVVLTFDCCGGPGAEALDHALVETLRTNGVPAAFFLNARWVHANLRLAQDLAGDPLFSIQNHGTRHLPLSVTGQSAYGIPGTLDAGEAYDEVMDNQAVLRELTGKTVRYFRSGTAHFDEVTAELVRALGLVPLNFTVNGDAGATFDAGAVFQQFSTAAAGDVVIAHANRPLSGTAAGVAAALPELKARGIRFNPLN